MPADDRHRLGIGQGPLAVDDELAKDRAWSGITASGGFRFGNLRHTGASLAIAAGANPMLVAARLGHSSMVEKHCVSLFEGLDREIGRASCRERVSDTV